MLLINLPLRRLRVFLLIAVQYSEQKIHFKNTCNFWHLFLVYLFFLFNFDYLSKAQLEQILC
jgi:hypothetical protein